MYYAQESNPTNIGKSKRTNPGLRPWPHKKYAPEKHPPGRPPPSIQRPQPRLSQLSLLPQKRCKVVHGLKRVRMIRTEVRFAPCKSSAVQGLRLASRDGTGGVGPQAWIRLRVPCGKGRKVGNGLEFGLMKKMSSTIMPCKCKCTHNSKLEESNAKFDELTFQHNLDVRHRRSNLPFANKLQPQGASVLCFFCKNALTASDISD